MMSIFKGFVVTLRVVPTAFYTPAFHVYILFVYSRFSWEDFGRSFSCLAYAHVPTSAFFLRKLRGKMYFPPKHIDYVLRALTCEYSHPESLMALELFFCDLSVPRPLFALVLAARGSP